MPRSGGKVRQGRFSRLVRGLSERVLQWRDDRLADPRVQSMVVSMPMFRGIANKRAREIFDLCAGFVHTQIVTAVVELGLLDYLAAGPRRLEDFADASGLSHDAAGRLLNAAVAIKLISRLPDGRYRLSELGAALRGATGISEMIRHNQTFYRDLSDPVALLREPNRATELASFWPYAPGGAEAADLPEKKVSQYSALMSATQPLIAADVVAAYDFRRHRAVLDVGGGEGAFACTVAAAVPALDVAVFDLPAVSARARARFAEMELSHRANVFAGDFHRDEIPSGFDLVTLVRVLLDHDDPTVLKLLRSLRRSMRPGTRLLVAEIMSGATGAETIADAYFGFYLLAMGRGRPRTAAEIGALLEEAGFCRIRAVPTRRALMTQVVVADVA